MLTLSSASLASLFLALLLLALVPGTSVLVVSSRAATSGFKQGAYAALGIVAADVFFILLALFGLSVVSWLSETLLLILRVLLGFLLFRAGLRKIRQADRPPPAASLPVTTRSAASFAMGFLLTLVDVKAAVFYFGFLQAFVNVGRLTATDILAVLGTAVVAVGGAKLGYAFAASKLDTWVGPRLGRNLVRAGGVLMLSVGAFLAATAFVRPSTLW
jgi:threonine/homoserine/homoserine lactone efflux protein